MHSSLTVRLVLWSCSLLVLQLIGCAHHNEIHDKVIVITGASSGFGKGVAQRLAAQGAHVVLAARRTMLIEELARESGNQAMAVTTDVSNENDVERLARTAIAQFGRIDVWINNAGVGVSGRFEEVPLADHARVIQTNLLGALYGSHFALRQFRKQGHGTLINIASVLGKIGSPYYTSYSASKFGIVGLGEALNQELRLSRAENIHVTTINPMASDTPFWEHAANYSGHMLGVLALDDPEHVIDTIVDAIKIPSREVSVGFSGKSSVFFHRMAPETASDMLGSALHKAQMENAPAASTTAGNLYEPIATGTEIRGKAKDK
jgi:short-subunit dehydrogenase